mgnify:CR=1 FL=1
MPESEYLRGYIAERLRPWNEGKKNDFIPKLVTKSARDVATAKPDGADHVRRECVDRFPPEGAPRPERWDRPQPPQQLIC